MDIANEEETLWPGRNAGVWLTAPEKLAALKRELESDPATWPSVEGIDFRQYLETQIAALTYIVYEGALFRAERAERELRLMQTPTPGARHFPKTDHSVKSRGWLAKHRGGGIT